MNWCNSNVFPFNKMLKNRLDNNLNWAQSGVVVSMTDGVATVAGLDNVLSSIKSILVDLALIFMHIFLHFFAWVQLWVNAFSSWIVAMYEFSLNWFYV